MTISFSSLVLPCVPVAAIVFQEPQPAAPEVAAAGLFMAIGAEYVAQRDALLDSSQEEFDATVTALRATPGSYRPAALADALALRRSNPGLAAEFDGLPQAALDNSLPTASGTPILMLFGDVIDPPPRFGPLIVEFVLKRNDSRADIRTRFAQAVPAEVEATLAVLEIVEEVPNSFGFVGERASRLAATTLDPRLPAAIGAAFDRYRDRYPEDYHLPHQATCFLREVHSSAALEALRGIIDSERTRMELLGLSPWNDVDAKESYGTALLARARQKAAATKAQERLDPETEAELDVAVAAAKSRSDRRSLWESINGTLAAREALE